MRYLFFFMISLLANSTFAGQLGGGTAIQFNQVEVEPQEMLELIKDFKQIDSIESLDGRKLNVIGMLELKNGNKGILTVDDRGEIVRLMATPKQP